MILSEKLGSGAIDRLRSFLASPDRPENALTYNELQGFLFAIACSPEMVPPGDWLTVVFGDEEANYGDIDEVNTILQSIMILYNQCNQQVVDGELTISPSCKPLEAPLDNFTGGAPLAQWAQGFLIGHSYLDELWNECALDEWGEELGSCLMVLSFFADRRLAEAYQEEALAEECSLEELAQNILGVFEEAMMSYAHMGRSIYLARLEVETEEELELEPGGPASLDKTGRNEPCPCGSGKKFKKCCGAPEVLH